MSVVVLSLDDAVHALEAAVITLTGLNAIAAASVLVLVWLDNRSHRTKSTALSRKLRLPLYLAITILLGQIIFIIRETLELGVINSDKIQSCTVMSEFTWFAIWLPIVAMTLRACAVVGGILFKYDVYSSSSEVVYCSITVLTSVLFWMPSHILASPPCSPFVMTFSAMTDSTLGLVGIILLSSLLSLLCVSLTVIVWDVCRPPPPNRLSLHLEFDPSVMEEAQMRQRKEISTMPSVLSYGLGASCTYAALLPNFTMVAISRISAPAIYVASIAIHLSGILLLLQYLYIRGSSNQNESTSPPTMREIEHVQFLRTRNTNRQSTASNHSTQSDEFTRKRRRPHSTYGGGGDYLRRESSNFSWDSLSGPLVDRTASGRRIPPRSPGMRLDFTTAERPRTAEQPKIGDKAQSGTPLRRWKSYSGDAHPSIINEPRVPLKQETLKEEEESETPRPTTSGSRKLRRRLDHIPSKSDLTELLGENNVVTPEPPRDSLEALSKRESPSQLSRPVLLPPLLDPMISRSALQKQEAASRPSNSKGTSESSSSKPRPPSNILPSQSDGSTPISPSTSDFVFPFQSRSETDSVNNEEPVQSTSSPNDAPVSGSLANLVQQAYSWSVNIEDLIQPDPPFVSEDHFYIGSPTSESRLSTITEEGTVRSVSTPPNVIISDTPTPRGSPSVMMRTITPLSANTTNWYAQGGAQYDVNRAMNQFRKTPSPPEGGERQE